MDVGQRLEESSWRQGTFLPFPGLRYLDLSVDPPAFVDGQSPFPSVGILASHDCDIVKLEIEEPTVEVLRLDVVPTSEIGRYKHGHERKFVVEEGLRLVSDIRNRATLPKRKLLGLEPLGQLDPSLRHRFRQWLAGRYARSAAEPDLFAAAIRPTKTYLKKVRKSAAEDLRRGASLVRSIRLGRTGTADPMSISVFLVLDQSQAELNQEDYLAAVAFGEGLRQSIRETAEATVHLVGLDEITMSEWIDTLSIDAGTLTYKGEEIEGAEPFDWYVGG